jgi:hypothetical protein
MKMKNLVYILIALPGVLWAQYTGGIGGGYDSDVSDEVFTVVTTSTYSPPSNDLSLIIDSDVSINTGTNNIFKKIIVNPGFSFSTTAPATLTDQLMLLADADGYSEVNICNLTFAAEAQFAQQQWVPANGWHNMALPLNGDAELEVFGTVNENAPNANPNTVNLKYWDAENSQWVKAEANEENIPGRGYNAYVGNLGVRTDPGIIEARGLPITSLTPTIQYDSPTDPQSGTFFGTVADGWNLVANPFPATLDFSSLSAFTNVERAFYVWDPTLNSGEGAYLAWAPAALPGDIEEWDLLDDPYIAPMQSFWVRATNASAPSIGSIDCSNLLLSESPDFFKTSEILGNVQLRLTNTSKTMRDGLSIAFIPGTTQGFDNGWDARKMYNPNPSFNFYTLGNQEALSINAVDFDPNSNSVYSIPLGIANVKNGQDLSISVSGLEDFSRLTAFIEDTKDGSFHNLAHGPFNFKAANSNPDQQYIFHISGVPGWTPKDLVSGVNAWVNGGHLHLLPMNLEGDANVFIADMTGRDIWRHPENVHLQSNQQLSLDMPVQLASGVYLLKVVANGKVHVVKFVQ